MIRRALYGAGKQGRNILCNLAALNPLVAQDAFGGGPPPRSSLRSSLHTPSFPPS